MIVRKTILGHCVFGAVNNNLQYTKTKNFIRQKKKVFHFHKYQCEAQRESLLNAKDKCIFNSNITCCAYLKYLCVRLLERSSYRWRRNGGMLNVNLNLNVLSFRVSFDDIFVIN